MKKYFLGEMAETRDYKLMSQAGVKQYVYPLRHTHNAIWDSTVGPDGKFYYALASEIATNNYVRFCRYDFNTHSVEELFKIEDVILPTDRSIRASKFHTSICFMNNGNIVATTHTTDKSPRHPTWMPIAHYHHLWEGFAGGHIIEYNPKTKEVKTLGIPVPQESIYGATYDPKHNALFFLGFMRGFLYRYSFDEKRVQCLGKVSENNSFRLTLGPDGNIYGSSRTGWVFKVDVDTLKIIDLNFQFEHVQYEYSTRYNMSSIARIGHDNRLYFAVMYSKNIYALDTKTGKMENMGWYLPTDRYIYGENRHGIFGMDFDNKGVLWYAVTSLNNYESYVEHGIPASLFRWDISRGGKPEWAGILGTPEFGGAWISEVSIFKKDNILYAANSNHSLDGPGLIGIDLDIFEPTMKNIAEPLKDKYFDPSDPGYIESNTFIHDQENLLNENPTAIQMKPFSPILLWRELAPDNIEESAVKGLYWEDNNTLKGVCGNAKQYVFTIKNNELVSLVPADEADPACIEKALSRDLPDFELKEALPHYPGRQYKAVTVAAASLSGGRMLVGTLDGMLAVVDKGKAYALGPAAFNGPIHQMASTPDGKKVYGVGGDEDDMAVLFSYSDDEGLRWLGFFDNGVTREINDVFYCTIVRSCAISPDGKYLAIGSDERIGTVVIYPL